MNKMILWTQVISQYKIHLGSELLDVIKQCILCHLNISIFDDIIINHFLKCKIIKIENTCSNEYFSLIRKDFVDFKFLQPIFLSEKSVVDSVPSENEQNYNSFSSHVTDCLTLNANFKERLKEIYDRLCDRNIFNIFNKGIIIKSAVGNGKTTFLLCLSKYFKCSKYVDIKEVIHSIVDAVSFKNWNSSDIMLYLDRLFHCDDNQLKFIFLLDNMDSIFDYQNQSIFFSIYFILFEVLDCLFERGIIILISLSSIPSSEVENFSPLRFPYTFYLDNPDDDTKLKLLSRNHYSVSSNLLKYDFLSILNITKGYSFYDFKNFILRLNIEDLMNNNDILNHSFNSFASNRDDFIEAYTVKFTEPPKVYFDHHLTLFETVDLINQSIITSTELITGILVEGMHGNGKTLFVNHLAYEFRSRFKFLSVSCADLVDKVVGAAEKKLSKIFHLARSIAPCFLFFDDIEIILGHNSHSTQRTSNKSLDRILSTFLVEMDGINNSSNDNDQSKAIIILAAVSDKSLIDKSITRPGRLEHHVFLSGPSPSDLQKVFKYYIDKPFSLEPKDICDIETKCLSIHDISYASLNQLLQDKVMNKLRDVINVR